MSTEVKRRRGTTIEHGSFTGAIGEITIDLDKDTVVVHDGATQGGFSLLREDFSNANWLAPDGRYLLEYNNLSDITSASSARSNLGLGSISTLNSINNNNWSGSDLTISNGGTGASSASVARSNLGLEIGVDVQAYNANLTTYASNPLTPSELGQLQNIGSTTISSAQWGYLGVLNQNLRTSDNVSFQDVTFNNKALISHTHDSSNIDHIWHDDSVNTWHLVSDSAYKATGNANLRVGAVNTGQGNNELYAMNQNVRTSDNVTFNNVSPTGTVDGRNISLDGNKLDELYTTIGLSALTSSEVNQLENIGSTTISSTQWGYLGVLNQNLRTSDNVSFQDVSLDVSYFDTSYSPTGNEGQGAMYWNPDELTLSVVTNGTTVDLGQHTEIQVRNNSGSTIAKGKVVYATGTVGNSGIITVDEMICDGTIEAKYVLGVTHESISNGSDGKVVKLGKLRHIDTTSFSEGDVLWVSTTVAGGFQNTEPSQEDGEVSIPIAFVVTEHVNVGEIFVRVTPVNENEHAKYTDLVSLTSDVNELYTTIGLSDLTSFEVDQLENIGTTTISATQWGYLGSMNQNVRTSDDVTFGKVTAIPSGTIGGTNLANAGLLVGTTSSGIGIDANEIISKGGDLYIRPSAGGSKLFLGAGSASSKIVVDSSNGYIGVNTSSPAANFHIRHSADEILRLNHSSETGNPFVSFYQGSTRRGFVQYQDSTNKVRLASEYGHISLDTGIGGNFIERMRITADGNVGIGTTSPDLKLHLDHTDNNNGLLLENSNNINNYQVLLNIRENEGLIFQRWLNGTFSSNLMTIGYDGEVGIGTTSPSYKLDVNGTLRASTLNTGQGNNELYAMNQNVRTTDNVTFNWLYLSGSPEAGLRINSPNGAKVNIDARNEGDGARIHKWNGNYQNTSYLPYYENWYDGNSYHSIGIENNTWKLSDGLDVNGNTRIVGTNNDYGLTIVRGNAPSQYLNLRGYQVLSSGNHLLLTSDASKDVWIGSLGNESNVIVKSNGNFLIGTATDSGYKLNVNGDIKVNDTINFVDTYNYIRNDSSVFKVYGNLGFELGTILSGSEDTVLSYAEADQKLTSHKNVSVNSSKLEVQSGSASANIIAENDGTLASNLRLRSTTRWLIQSTTAGDLSVYDESLSSGWLLLDTSENELVIQKNFRSTKNGTITSRLNVGNSDSASTWNSTVLETHGSIFFNNHALISSQQADNTNVDHIWYNDTSEYDSGGTWNFVADAAYKSQGNALLRAGNIYLKDSGKRNYIAGSLGLGVTDPLYKLDVNGTLRATSDATFNSNVYVEGGLFAKEFVVNQTKVLFDHAMTVGGGKISTKTGSAGSETITFQDENGSAFVPVAVNDIIHIQQRTGLTSGVIVKSIRRKVSSITSNNITLTTSGISWTTSNDVGSIEVGDHAVVKGSTSNTSRDHYISFDLSATDSPRMLIYDGVTDVTGGNVRGGFGNLAGHYGFSSGTPVYGVAAGDSSKVGNYFYMTPNSSALKIDDFDLVAGNLLINSGNSTQTAYSPTSSNSLLDNYNFSSAPNFSDGQAWEGSGDITPTYDSVNGRFQPYNRVLLDIPKTSGSNRSTLEQELDSISGLTGKTITFKVSVTNGESNYYWYKGVLNLEIRAKISGSYQVVKRTTVDHSDVTTGGTATFSVTCKIRSDYQDLKIVVEAPQQDMTTGAPTLSHRIYINSVQTDLYDRTQVTLNNNGLSVYNSPISKLEMLNTGSNIEGIGIKTDDIQIPNLVEQNALSLSTMRIPSTGYVSMAYTVISGTSRLYFRLPDGSFKYVNLS